MFDIDATPIDPELIDFSGKNNMGKSGGRGLIYSQERGRYIKPMIPRGEVRRKLVVLLVLLCRPHARSSTCTCSYFLSRMVAIEEHRRVRYLERAPR